MRVDFSQYRDDLGRFGEFKFFWDEKQNKAIGYIELGDSLQRLSFFTEGEIYYCELEAGDIEKVFKDYASVLHFHEISPGHYVRGSGFGPFNDYGTEKITSRDQLRGHFRALSLFARHGLVEAKLRLSRLLKEHLKRFLFFPNTRDLDPLKREKRRFPDNSFAIIDELLRSTMTLHKTLLILYPFLFFFDLVNTLGTISKLVQNHTDKTKTDNDHRIMNLIYCSKVFSTFISKFNLWLFFKFSKSHRSWYFFDAGYKKPEFQDCGVIYFLDHKYAKPSAPPFNEFYRPLLQHLRQSLGL